MILYYAPGACSLADHIALHDAGLSFSHVKVDLKTKTTETGADYTKINPKGYVPALTLDSGETLTENVAILSWIAAQKPGQTADGITRFRALEALAFISTEIHKSFKPFFNPEATEKDKAAAKTALAKRFGYLADRLYGGYLLGGSPSVADFYLFVMLTWARKNSLEVPQALSEFYDRIKALPAVRKAFEHEGLGVP